MNDIPRYFPFNINNSFITSNSNSKNNKTNNCRTIQRLCRVYSGKKGGCD